MEMLEEFVTEPVQWDCRLFYLWGHSYEFEANDNWNVIEAFAERAGGRDDFWYATNIEIFEYIEAYRQLRFSADCGRVFNPTSRVIWFGSGEHIYSVQPGEMLEIE